MENLKKHKFDLLSETIRDSVKRTKFWNHIDKNLENLKPLEIERNEQNVGIASIVNDHSTFFEKIKI